MDTAGNTPKPMVRRDGTVELNGAKIGSVGRGWGGTYKLGLWEASLVGGKNWGGYETRAEAVEALVEKYNKKLALDARMVALEARLAAKRNQKN